MKAFNIYLIGVGGQGIGLLSEAIIRAIDSAGIAVKGVDTHGLAQRGGTVTSHIRMGGQVFSPLNSLQNADLVIALERHEALRGLNTYIKQEGTLLYYDAVWQSLNVRLRKEKQYDVQQISETCKTLQVKEHRVFIDELSDARMQNVALLAYAAKEQLIPGIEKEHYLNALKSIMDEKTFDLNQKLFQKICNEV